MTDPRRITPFKRAMGTTLAAAVLAVPLAVAAPTYAGAAPNAVAPAAMPLATITEPVVPEPSGVALAMVAALPLLARRRR